MKEHNYEELDGEQHKSEHKSDDYEIEENFDLENNFIPREENSNDSKPFEIEFDPRDKDEFNDMKSELKLKSTKEPKLKEKKDEIQQDGRRASKKIGNFSELQIMKEIENQGKKILLPYGDNQRYDVLFEENNNFYRVQVKTVNKKGEHFRISSFTKNGESKNYVNDIEYFGVYNRLNNKSYLIPIDEINKQNTSNTFNLTNSIKDRFQIVHESSASSENTSDLKLIKAGELMKEGNIVLNQLGKRNDNIIINDKIQKTQGNTLKHNFQEIPIVSEENNKKSHDYRTDENEIESATIAADLMINGYIISTPIKNNPKYDFAIQKKYQKKDINPDRDFHSVKVIENKIKNRKISEILKDVDYVGLYNSHIDKSYLIPAQEFKIGTKNSVNYEIKRSDNVLKEMNANDKGDAVEMKIGAEFIKSGYEVYHPLFGKAPYDLMVKKEDRYYTVEVKAGRTYHEKQSTYLRFNTASQKTNHNGERPRSSYKGRIDLIASINQDNLKSYIVPVINLPNNDAKLKLDERKDMRREHHGTIWAKDYEFENVDRIIQLFEKKEKERKRFELSNQEIKKQPQELRMKLENKQILSALQGNTNVNEITSSNSNLQRYITEFNRNFPKSQIEYQGILSASFRDFLIEQPELKPIIENRMKKRGLFGEDGAKHRKVYDFIDDFYNENGRTPNSLELYQNFLNFKSHELRGKMNHSRKLDPKYYRKIKPIDGPTEIREEKE